ncbi:replication-relaxation family protein [Streptomyces sp. DSM 41524]|uniref:Replication-relaxation family protein n=1 Tax=Streptomyces asiaticus subsp. ignotus TaxID=3098222 RepID=A0ABU7Q323_9ACTN|nr:replication-relaxation family protein [Streptomyces sp. DSM 41524]
MKDLLPMSTRYSTSASVPRLTEADETVLRAVNRFHYMTAAQVGRLVYPQCRDENRYAQRRLRRLVEADYLLRLRELPAPRFGSAPHVFTLADRGRRHLADRGVSLASSYYRPSEEYRKAWDNPFMEHTLAAVDVLVAAELLCREFDVSMPRLLTERQLKRETIRVRPTGHPDARPVAVIPDAWFELSIAHEPADCVALELDRGTEEQAYWRRKIAALTAWALGPYREAFEADNLTVATVAPTTARRRTLASWTYQELKAIGQTDIADIFLFTEVSPVTAPPDAFFFGRFWYPAGQTEPVSLLDLPEEGQR